MLKTPNGLMSVVFVFVLMSGFGLMWLTVSPNHELHKAILEQNRDLVNTLKSGQENLNKSFQRIADQQDELVKANLEKTRLLKHMNELIEQNITTKPTDQKGASLYPLLPAQPVVNAG